MTGNGLDVKVTPEDFDKIDSDTKKLSLIFRVLNSLQKDMKNQTSTCSNTVNEFKAHFKDCDRLVKNATTIPRRNRKIDVGIGTGAGAGGYIIIDKIIDIIKSYISGG